MFISMNKLYHSFHIFWSIQIIKALFHFVLSFKFLYLSVHVLFKKNRKLHCVHCYLALPPFSSPVILSLWQDKRIIASEREIESFFFPPLPREDSQLFAVGRSWIFTFWRNSRAYNTRGGRTRTAVTTSCPVARWRWSSRMMLKSRVLVSAVPVRAHFVVRACCHRKMWGVGICMNETRTRTHAHTPWNKTSTMRRGGCCGIMGSILPGCEVVTGRSTRAESVAQDRLFKAPTNRNNCGR